MKKKLQIDKYDFKIYPRDLYIAIGKDTQKLINTFTFYYTSVRKEKNLYIQETIEEPSYVGGTFSISNNITGRYGVLLYIPDITLFEQSDISHESVHIADYIFQEVNISTESFADGNEGYAYLVGWIAGCISSSIIKYKAKNNVV